MNTVGDVPLKALIYVQHLLGTGHAVRAAAIGRALSGHGVNVLLVTGNALPPTLDTSGLTIHALPYVRAASTDFTDLIDADGNKINDAWRAARGEALKAVYLDFQPDILLTETFPFGRRQFAFELLPLLEDLPQGQQRPIVATSVRDILVRKNNPKKERWMAEVARTHYDVVLVHSDPTFVTLADSFPYASEVDDLIRYTGYVHETRKIEPPENDGVDEVVVSCGGGAVGHELLEAALSARALSKNAGDATWRLLVGHQHDLELIDRLAATAPAGVIVERARPDFPGLLKRARLSVSQAGYNTVNDILVAGCAAVFVPFKAQGETEQTQRAELLERRGIARVVAEEDLSPISLAAAADAALDLPAAHLPVSLDGAEHSANILIDTFKARHR